MLAYTYIEKGRFSMLEKPVPELKDPCDALVRVTLGSICTSDLHIRHGSVPRAVPGITVGHEMVGIVEQVGSGVTTVKPGDRVTVNVETFCGECFFCQKGYVNNCEDPVITLNSLQKFSTLLPPYFMRVHRSYIVNLHQITEVSRFRILFGKDTYIPIGENYKEQFMAYIQHTGLL